MKHFFKPFCTRLGRFAVPLFFVILVCLDLSFRYFYALPVSLRLLNSEALIFTLGWAALLTGMVRLLPVRIRRVAMIAVVVFCSLICIVHGVMFNLFGNFFSFADLAYTGDGAKFFSFTYLKVRKALLLCCALAVAGITLAAVHMPKSPLSRKSLAAGLVLMAVGAGSIFWQHDAILDRVPSVFAWDAAGNHDTDANNYKSMTNVNRVMSQTGIYQYLFRSCLVSSGLEDRMQFGAIYETLDQYYTQSEKNSHPDNEMTGLFEGKNMIYIMLESLDSWLLTQEYTPNLYAVKEQSIDFVNHYSPLYISAGTFNTEFIANTGLVPPTSGVDSKVYADNEFPNSLAKLFAAKGYSANSFHSANGGIYNRSNIHLNLGYEAYHNWSAMGMENYMLDSQMVNGFHLMTAGDPFFSFVITFSGHGPYTGEMSDISDAHIDQARRLVAQADVPLTGSDLEEYTYAVAHAMETDAFVGGLMEKLEESGLLEDTVLVFFTDHYGKYMTSNEALYALKGVNSKDMLCNTPFFIYSADTPAREVTKVTSTMDIAPTLANLFRLDANYAWYAGDDIFGDGGGYVIFQGNNWYDGEIYYTPAYTGQLTDEILQRNLEITQRMNMAWDALRSNYFAQLEDAE